MNVSRMLGILTAATAVAIISGCSKQEQPAATTAPAASATEAPAPAADKTIQAAPAIAPAPAADAATADSTQTQGLIDKAKSLVDNSQYTDASTILQELSSMKLTPDQQKAIDDLKALIQKKLADQGSSALGGLLNK